jgi:hypothetical protein
VAHRFQVIINDMFFFFFFEQMDIYSTENKRHTEPEAEPRRKPNGQRKTRHLNPTNTPPRGFNFNDMFRVKCIECMWGIDRGRFISGVTPPQPFENGFHESIYFIYA